MICYPARSGVMPRGYEMNRAETKNVIRFGASKKASL